MVAIPQYRAKKIDSDESVIGYLHRANNNPDLITIRTGNIKIIESVVIDEMFRIDPSTLAIHFPDMIDSEGTKIFASLSEDGGGGDTCEDIKNNEKSSVVLFQDYEITFKEALSEDRNFFDLLVSSRLKVTGIQE